ncbi:TMV resistance protein N-like isoform X2 [Solanum stenotomum]|uniref:TMV resistance protein N-like isoform X2 n=1 Tax=Solanum stenotomum TaxID=172797 RepID=UPI0020D19E36|nr:TMV resistance protein N-like isoform X2 [Solanum stenotomum]
MAFSSSFSSASNSHYCPRWKYNVFLSFRGVDTRRTFTGHLYEGLKHRGIFTFQDDKRLENGNSIPEELLKAIEESQVALVIFSKNYATSRWCLNELVKIMECKEEENGQTVIPIFYDVDPSHVRYQSESFAEAFTKHESRYKDDVEGMQKVQGWRTALTAAANLKGYDIRDGIESEKIQLIVDFISSKFCKSDYSLSFLQDVVGINAHLERLKSQLQIEINDVRIVGIWGTGGIGKTTIAKAIFDTLSHQFKAACFLVDIKENAKPNRLHSLQNTLLSELLRKKDNYVNNKYDGKCMIPSRLSSMKVLIVLDDIDHGDHLEYLAGDVGWFGNGSRVIVTTRNRHLIEKDAAIYKVPTLPDHEAMQLFNQHAFKKEVPDECFKKFSLEVVNQAKGLPLAIKVWGSMLHKKGIDKWEKIVDQIKKKSNLEIVEKLKISYDGLEPEEQKIFLDIACFFRGHDRKQVMKIVESYDFGAEYILDVLIDKSLVFKSEYDDIEMHDLIEDMGKYIVKMQKDSGEPSRIWNVEDFEDVMMGNMGTMTVEAIWLTYFKNVSFSTEAIKNMQRLRILCIQTWASQSDSEDGSIEYLSNNLCWFVWHHYPWKLLPENFNPRRLVHLDLQRSSLHYLWNETKLQQFLSLRRIDLSYSRCLKRTPDFKGMPNLEYLDLKKCTSLEEVDPSLKYCKKLIHLNLYECESLERFPYVNVESLEYLDLCNCYSLEKFPETSDKGTAIKIIKMSNTRIRELPLSFFDHQPHLTELDLSFMRNLASLPSSIYKLKGLVKLSVSWCLELASLPEEIGGLENLEVLDASYTLISRPPSSIVRLNKLKSLRFGKADTRSEDGVYFEFPPVNKGLLSLESLDLSYCNIIDGRLPEDIGSLSSLKELNLSYCNIIDGGLPEDIGRLSSLEELDLCGNNFEHLPRSIAQLCALGYLELSDCKRLIQLPEDIGSLSSLERLNLQGNNFDCLPQSISELGALRLLDLSDCERLTQLPEFPQQLHTIDADWSNASICNSLFQNISSLQHDICSSHSLSLRVFGSWAENIPSWFDYKGMGTSVSVNLPKNWYVSDNFLGFAVCYSYKYYIDCITAHLIPLCDDGLSSMTQQFALSNNSEYSDYNSINFLLVPLGGLWDASNANGKTPNDYGCFRLFTPGQIKEYGVRLLYKDEAELHIGIRKSRYEEEATCSSSKKQRSQVD